MFDRLFQLGIEAKIRSNIKSIAKSSCLDGVDAQLWDVTRISWTGEEWDEFRPIAGYCYVEAFEHAIPPHDFIYLVKIEDGEPKFAAAFEGDLDFFELTISLTDIDSLDLPDRVRRP